MGAKQLAFLFKFNKYLLITPNTPKLLIIKAFFPLSMGDRKESQSNRKSTARES